jgi:effector-binding domain-containing protein
MPSKKTFLSVSVILVVILVSVFFYPRKEFRQIIVPLPIERTISQFTDPVRVQHWFKAIASNDSAAITKEGNGRWVINADQHALRIITANSFSAVLELSEGQEKKRFVYTASVAPDNVDQTRITLNYRTNLFRKLTGEPSLINAGIESIQNLEAFTNSTKRFYGYEIRHTLVTDSAYLFTTKSVAKGSIQKAAVEVFDNLIAYARKNKIQFTGTKIINIFPLPGDSIRVSGGIAVTSYYVPAASDNISYKNMPYGKKLLEAPFKGSYSELPIAYSALLKYSQDNNLTSMAIPYGKFLTDNYSYSDNDIIDLMVYYPVD